MFGDYITNGITTAFNTLLIRGKLSKSDQVVIIENPSPLWVQEVVNCRRVVNIVIRISGLKKQI